MPARRTIEGELEPVALDEETLTAAGVAAIARELIEAREQELA
jgi:hypothetical protein